jgi:hypothetical protein
MDDMKRTESKACSGKLFKQPTGGQIGGGTTFHQDKGCD